MSIQAKFCSVQDVGKNIKSSKKKFTWRFVAEGQEFHIDFFVSKLSGKKKIVMNGKTVYENKSLLSGQFNYPFNIGHNCITIYQRGDSYDLRINNQSFSVLYTREQTKQQFEYDDPKKYRQNEDADYNYPKNNYDQGEQYGQKKQVQYQGYGNDEYEYQKGSSGPHPYSQDQHSQHQKNQYEQKYGLESQPHAYQPKSQHQPKEKAGDEFDFVSGFQKFSQYNPNDHAGNQSKAVEAQKQPVIRPEIKKQEQKKNDFTDFTQFNFGASNAQKNTTQQKDIFSQFDNFNMKFENTAGSNNNGANKKLEPQPKKEEPQSISENLLDMDDVPAKNAQSKQPVETQSQSLAHQNNKQAATNNDMDDLFDVIDNSVKPQANVTQQQTQASTKQNIDIMNIYQQNLQPAGNQVGQPIAQQQQVQSSIPNNQMTQMTMSNPPGQTNAPAQGNLNQRFQALNQMQFPAQMTPEQMMMLNSQALQQYQFMQMQNQQMMMNMQNMPNKTNMPNTMPAFNNMNQMNQNMMGSMSMQPGSQFPGNMGSNPYQPQQQIINPPQNKAKGFLDDNDSVANLI